jgi:hypothetical protein
VALQSITWLCLHHSSRICISIGLPGTLTARDPLTGGHCALSMMTTNASFP